MKKSNQGISVVFVVGFLTLMGPSLFPNTLEEILPQLAPAEIATLRERKELIQNRQSAPEFRLLPTIALSSQIRDFFRGYSPNVSNEALFLLPYPSEASRSLITLYNRLRAVSTLNGIKYRSHRARGMRVLFSDVFALKDIRSRTPVPDPIVQTIPASESFPIHLVDANFGSDFYKASYLVQDNSIVFGLKNLTSLDYIFPIIGAERFRTQLVVIPLESEILLYGVTAVEAWDLIRSLVHLPGAFYVRMVALKNWFHSGL